MQIISSSNKVSSKVLCDVNVVALAMIGMLSAARIFCMVWAILG